MNRTQTLKHGTFTQFNQVVEHCSVAQVERALRQIETRTEKNENFERIQDLKDELKRRKDGKN